MAAVGGLAAAGLLTGLIVGFLRPHTRDPFGALLVGFVASGPIVTPLQAVVVKRPPTAWANDDWAMALIFWAIVAAFLASQLYRAAKEAPTE